MTLRKSWSWIQGVVGRGLVKVSIKWEMDAKTRLVGKELAQWRSGFTFRFRSKVSICSFMYSRNIFVDTHSAPTLSLRVVTKWWTRQTRAERALLMTPDTTDSLVWLVANILQNFSKRVWCAYFYTLTQLSFGLKKVPETWFPHAYGRSDQLFHRHNMHFIWLAKLWTLFFSQKMLYNKYVNCHSEIVVKMKGPWVGSDGIFEETLLYSCQSLILSS